MESSQLKNKKILFSVKNICKNNKISEENLENQNYLVNNEMTLIDIINNTKSGIPMILSKNTIIKQKKNKRKTESDLSDSFSLNNSNQSVTISTDKGNKHFLRNKKEKDLEGETNEKPVENYGKYFKPKLLWDPVTNKMIIEKPKIMEASQKMQDDLMKNNTPIFDFKNDHLKISSSSFKKINHSKKWNEDENTFFYKCLECFGTDFSFLEIVLKPRNRSQIKNKFRKEEKQNPNKVNNALKCFDPKKLTKILTIFKKYKENNHNREIQKKIHKKTKNIEKNDIDFRKLIEDVELHTLSIDNSIEDLNHLMKEEESEISDSEKTISDIQDYMNEEKKISNINVTPLKPSSVNMVFNKTVQIKDEIKIEEENLIGKDKNNCMYDFLKNFE